MTLKIADVELEVAQVTPDQIFLRTAVDLSPCDAELIISVDGRVSHRQVTLPNGASVESKAFETR